MGELVSLEAHRNQKAALAAYGRWPRLVGFAPEPALALPELPDQVLLKLADLGDDATLALYDLVLGVRGWGGGERFLHLPADRKMTALDAFLFITDLVRFELMRRLDWVADPPGRLLPLMELALHHQRYLASPDRGVPPLSPAYPRFGEVSARLRLEPGAVVRSLIPEALGVFHRRLVEKG